jgi:hypothetical protein
MAMINHLGHYLAPGGSSSDCPSVKSRAGSGTATSARALGGCNTLRTAGACIKELLEGVVAVLGVERAVVRDLLKRDRTEYLQQWESWVNEPVLITIIVRWMAAVYGHHRLPADITTAAEAIAHAQELARGLQRRVCVESSRRSVVMIDGQGAVHGRIEATPDDDLRPFMQIGKDRRLQFDE